MEWKKTVLGWRAQQRIFFSFAIKISWLTFFVIVVDDDDDVVVASVVVEVVASLLFKFFNVYTNKYNIYAKVVKSLTIKESNVGTNVAVTLWFSSEMQENENNSAFDKYRVCVCVCLCTTFVFVLFCFVLYESYNVTLDIFYSDFDFFLSIFFSLTSFVVCTFV